MNYLKRIACALVPFWAVQVFVILVLGYEPKNWLFWGVMVATFTLVFIIVAVLVEHDCERMRQRIRMEREFRDKQL